MKYSANLSLTATASLLALLVPSQGAFCIPKDGSVFKVGAGAVSISILKKLWSIQVAFTIFSATPMSTTLKCYMASTTARRTTENVLL